MIKFGQLYCSVSKSSKDLQSWFGWISIRKIVYFLEWMSFFRFCDHLKMYFLGVRCSSVQCSCSPKFFSSNQLFINLFSKSVTFTIFFQKCERENSHCVVCNFRNFPSLQNFFVKLIYSIINSLVKNLIWRNFYKNRGEKFSTLCGNFTITQILRENGEIWVTERLFIFHTVVCHFP